MLTAFLITLIKTVVFAVLIIHVVPIMLIIERRGCALMQDRPGPNRVGPFGLLQPLADVVKFVFKEHEVPAHVNPFLYNIAPFLSLIPAVLIIAALPFGDFIEVAGQTVVLQIADIDIGLLFILAIGSLGIYGILFGGWSSNNKFSLIGAMRSASQIVSYEIPLGLAAVGGVMVWGTFSLRQMTILQEGLAFGFLPHWGVFYQPLGFFVFFISAFAETNRMPFDLPESEAELVAGFHTEYGGMNFATYFMAEYMNMATISGMMTAIYFGGWHLPYITDASLLNLLGGSRLILGLLQIGIFLAKISVFMIIFVWVRWTVPRFRFDQLMHLAWKNLIPLSIVNLVVSAFILYFKEAQ